MATFFKKTLNNQTLETMEWNLDKDNHFHVQWSGTSRAAHLWTAHSKTRDFREVKWESVRLQNDVSTAKVKLKIPKDGFAAYYVDVEFPGIGVFNYNIATEIQVLPKGFEYEPPQQK